MKRTVYYVHIGNAPAVTFDNFEEAARYWDRCTYRLTTPIFGGIDCQQFNDDNVMTRDAWLIHVHTNGTVYVNPNMRGI